LWVSDEVITGFGRTGAWFSSTRYELKPDLMLTAKGLTSGYVPMGAVIASSELAAPFFSEGAGMWRHGYTYSGHAVAAAAGLANLSIIENERLIDRVARLELVLEAYLAPLADHPLVCDVRAGVGLLAAVQIAPDVENPARLNRVVLALREQGVLTRGLVDGSMQISPPFVIGESDIEFFVKKCNSSLNLVRDAED
ncbi:MAG: aminotransferase class III-fold pyridoxal phosphate-dependent enzyme, partial [Candidatus Nanopelagicales bacterium]